MIRKLKLVSAIVLLTMVASYPILRGQQSEHVEAIDRFVKDKLGSGLVQGLAIGIVQSESVLMMKGYGVSASKEKVTPDTRFAIASLSKAFTAMLVMQLVDAGQVKLDTPVTAYLPKFTTSDPRSASITVRQILNQTGGLGDRGFPELAFRDQPETLEASISRMNEAAMVSAPGEEFHYHNPNYQILAAIVESVSHNKFADVLHQRILVPLNMKNTNEYARTKDFMTPGRVRVMVTSIASECPWLLMNRTGLWKVLRE